MTTRHPLEAYRLDHDLSYAQLAQRILEITGKGRSDRTWQRVCEGAVTHRSTLYIVERFLADPRITQAAS